MLAISGQKPCLVMKEIWEKNIKSFKNFITMVDLPEQQQNLLALQDLQCFVLVWPFLIQLSWKVEESSSLNTCWIISCWFSRRNTSPKCTGLALVQSWWLSWTSQPTEESTLVLSDVFPPSDVFPLDWFIGTGCSSDRQQSLQIFGLCLCCVHIPSLCCRTE